MDTLNPTTCICNEKSGPIASPSRLFAATHRHVAWFASIDQSVIDLIPESKRRPHLCELSERGIDVYLGIAGKHPSGGCDFNSFRMGQFLFSVSNVTARKVFPKINKAVWEKPRAKKRVAA